MDGFVDILSKETIEFAGMARWVVTVLGMLNEIPITTTKVDLRVLCLRLTNRRKMTSYHR
jgi:hypothetical protein